MKQDEIMTIDLDTLSNGIPVIPSEAAGFYKQNCMVCFHLNGHGSGVSLLVRQLHSSIETSSTEDNVNVLWSGEVTQDLLRAYGDTKRATDNAACAIALLLIKEFTQFTAIEQSCVGSTIDYYLKPQQDQDDDLIFNQSWTLEVSGILTENKKNTVKSRRRQKLARLKDDSFLGSFIIIVEFSQPWSEILEK